MPVRLLCLENRPGARWRRGRTHRPQAASRFVVDAFECPPALAEAHAILEVLRTLSGSIWVCRASDRGIGAYRDALAAQELRDINGVPSLIVAPESLPEMATSVAQFWCCDPGRWVFASAHCEEIELSQVLRKRYSAMACRRAVATIGAHPGCAALSYDDSVVEGFSPLARDQLFAALRTVKGAVEIDLLLERM